MSSPQKPGQQLLPLKDPHNVLEVFAHELRGVQVRDDGTCHLTWTITRPGHRMPSGGFVRNDPDLDCVVTNRLVIPIAALPQVAETLRQVMLGMAMQKGEPPKAN